MDSLRKRRSLGERLAWDYQLYVEPADVPFVDDLLDRDARVRNWWVLGWMAVIAGLVGGAVMGMADWTAGLFVMAGIPYMWLVMVALCQAGRREPTTTVKTADLVPTINRLALALLATLGLGVAVWVARSPATHDPGHVLEALFPVEAWAISEAGAAWLSRAQLPADREGLRYAVLVTRSRLLRDGIGMSALVGAIGLSNALEWVLGFDHYVLASVIAFAPLLLVTLRVRPRERLRARLWPDLYPHQIVRTSDLTLPA